MSPRRGDPFFGSLIGLAGPALKKLAGKGLAKLTGGKLIGKGGATAAAKKIGGAVVGGGLGFGAVKKLPNLPGPFQNPFGGGGKRYRRMNAGNAKALRRAFRRIDAFTKLAKKAGYVRRKPYGSRKAS
jgi:hypothetical protein